MKITKEEKHLYKFLDVVNKIFGKTSNRTYLIGRRKNLYFYTLGYCGVFISKDNDETLVDAYDFEHKEYQLKRLPSKEYVLDEGNKSDFSILENVIGFIDNRCNGLSWQFELCKDYQCKAAKIAVHTNKWMRDDDLSLLKSFDSYELYTFGDGLLFNHIAETCDINLLFMDSVVAPGSDDATQLKLAQMEIDVIQARYSYSFEEQTQENENDTTGIIEPTEQNNAHKGSNEEIEDINEQEEYDDPMA